MFRIREYGGTNRVTLGDRREDKTLTWRMLSMSGSLSKLTSPILSSSIQPVGASAEPGYPYVNYSTASNQLFTSSSWTVECEYMFPRTEAYA